MLALVLAPPQRGKGTPDCNSLETPQKSDTSLTTGLRLQRPGTTGRITLLATMSAKLCIVWKNAATFGANLQTI